MMKHWTKSSIQGMRDFNDFELLKNWTSALQKGYYNESNWITNNIPMLPGDAKVGSSTFEKVPLFIGTNRISVILVAIGSLSVAVAPSIRLKVYDPDTEDEISYSLTSSGFSSSAKEMSISVNGIQQYLTYSYFSGRFESSGTYTNSNGLIIKRRAIVKVEKLTGSTWSTLDFMDSEPEFFIKFIESGVGFNNEKLPYFGQVIPADFYKSFNSMIKGDFTSHSEVSGNRFLNYIIPNYIKGESDIRTLQIDIKDAVSLKKIITNNDYWSYKDPTTSTVYSTTRMILPESGVFKNASNTFSFEYGVVQGAIGPVTNYSWTGEEKYSYTNWYEMKILGNDSTSQYISSDGLLRNEIVSLFLYDKRPDALGSFFYNIGSSSMLPGYEETSTKNLFEMYNPGTPISGELPVNNISLSIMKNTLALPFWTEAICNDVVSIFIGEYSITTINIKQNERFFMELRPSSIGDEDIDTTGLKVKFYV